MSGAVAFGRGACSKGRPGRGQVEGKQGGGPTAGASGPLCSPTAAPPPAPPSEPSPRRTHLPQAARLPVLQIKHTQGKVVEGNRDSPAVWRQRHVLRGAGARGGVEQKVTCRVVQCGYYLLPRCALGHKRCRPTASCAARRSRASQAPTHRIPAPALQQHIAAPLPPHRGRVWQRHAVDALPAVQRPHSHAVVEAKGGQQAGGVVQRAP